MDVLFPKIGEIIGGSEREADYDKLLARIEELGIPMKDLPYVQPIYFYSLGHGLIGQRHEPADWGGRHFLAAMRYLASKNLAYR